MAATGLLVQYIGERSEIVMKKGSIVRDKETDKLGYVVGFWKGWSNWMIVYWFDTGKKEEVVNISLEVLCEGG